MAWSKLIITLLFLSACVTSTRSVDICVLNVHGNEAYCAKKKKQYKLEVKKMRGWLAMDDLSYQIIGEKIAQCNVDGKLPKEDIFYQIEVCEMSADHVDCTFNGQTNPEDLIYVDGWFATNESGFQKIKAKLDYCMR